MRVFFGMIVRENTVQANQEKKFWAHKSLATKTIVMMLLAHTKKLSFYLHWAILVVVI